MMIPAVVVAPTFEALTLEEAKSWLQAWSDHRDADIQSALSTALEEVESRLDMALTRRTYRGTLDAWPVDSRGCTAREIALPFAPAISLTHVKVYDADGVPETMPASDYQFVASPLGDRARRPADGRIVLKSGATWPCVGQAAAGIEIEWVAGFAEAGDVPERARQAALILAHHAMENDPAAATTVYSTAEPPAVKRLLGQLRSWRF